MSETSTRLIIGKEAKNQRAQPSVMLPLLSIEAGVNKYPWLLSNLTWEWMPTENKNQMVFFCPVWKRFQCVLHTSDQFFFFLQWSINTHPSWRSLLLACSGCCLSWQKCRCRTLCLAAGLRQRQRENGLPLKHTMKQEETSHRLLSHSPPHASTCQLDGLFFNSPIRCTSVMRSRQIHISMIVGETCFFFFCQPHN